MSTPSLIFLSLLVEAVSGRQVGQAALATSVQHLDPLLDIAEVERVWKCPEVSFLRISAIFIIFLSFSRFL